MRKFAILAIVALIGGLVAGCTTGLFDKLTVQPSAPTVMVSEEDGGALVGWVVQSNGAVSVTVDYGDGASGRYNVANSVVIEHLYKQVGVYKAVFRYGAKHVESTVTVKAVAPKAYELWSTQGYNVVENDLVQLHVPYRVRGCDRATGKPLYVTGVLPGEGKTEFRLRVYNQDHQPISVFVARVAEEGEETPYTWNGVPIVNDNVWGEWLELEEPIATSMQHVYVFGGWTEEEPYHVIWPISLKGCDDDECDPWDEEPTVTPLWMDFELCARGQYAPFNSDGDMCATWRIYVTKKVCDSWDI